MFNVFQSLEKLVFFCGQGMNKLQFILKIIFQPIEILFYSDYVVLLDLD